MRVMGFVLLFNAIIVLLFVRQRFPPRKTGPFIEFKAFAEPSYTFFAFGAFFCFWAVYYAYDYVGFALGYPCHLLLCSLSLICQRTQFRSVRLAVIFSTFRIIPLSPS